ncbi:Cytosol aminopeptidase [Roseibaca ekhonensis]|uniref:Probable cytosol aminopeptidase n=1 Tax=Roseinatronobacter ekhonensis TaxID=254356 RepID=A0A3B0M768_9RHOB|nr:leucyl aminopeptidase [Roseibaca ekhonensis]SUZ31835.1 Cytosol aminopeptidase [Roseibaca ekhonensis]
MNTPTALPFDLDQLASHSGRVVIFADTDAPLPRAAKRCDKLTRGAVARAVNSAEFAGLAAGKGLSLGYPAGMTARSLQIIRLPRRPAPDEARRAGNSIGRAQGEDAALVALDTLPLRDIALHALLRAYRYEAMKAAPKGPLGGLLCAVKDPDAAKAALDDASALAQSVHLTRDLVHAPANVLNTESFAAQIAGLADLGLTVEILDRDEMDALGMRALLAVGQASDNPPKLAIMHWKGAEGPPLCVLGKGVMFDTGGISLKPGAGMEEMTMDMGGAAVTVGLMQALALRKAPAHVVGLVGLVENMPDARAQRPGDIVRSMKGDMIEVINTDAEGRLVLADMLHYAAERFQPRAMIDLATLTGAIIIALGHDRAGVFCNDDTLADAILGAARDAGEGAWRMPLGAEYQRQIDSRLGDVKNTGGRPAGSCTAAAFLERFVPDGMPWAHLDIAGAALTKSDSAHAPKGASGWGVLTLDALVRVRFEG